ncbi:GAF domain-containing protein [Candidatus Amarobacter glycogenicus]|uniref:GAF domain-containing protein n=1 Tax=Candidatus Amarobacter glycogenicus TaxID=3140699 RepID=UPI00313721BE|nr:GAF domain-containing protein [Dehalococcoidia bacterium]
MPGGRQAAGVLDTEAARAALVEVSASRDLEATLARSAEILLQRFGADMAITYVSRSGRRMFWAPATGPLSADSIFPSPQTFRDFAFAERVNAKGSSLVPDLGQIEARDKSREAVYARGIRSTMWTQLKDERGADLGFVFAGSLAASAFSPHDLVELEAFAAELALFARPSILLEEREAERGILEEEANLLAVMAEAETEEELMARAADGVRRAVGADLAILMVEDRPNREPAMRCSPPEALDAAQWKAAQAALSSSENASMSERSREFGAFTVRDLAEEARTPIERFMRENLRMRSLLAANRSHNWGGLGLGVAALREGPGSWTESERTFIARTARVLEISIERLRRGVIAVDHAVKLERQADLVATGAELVEALSAAGNLEQACDVISARLREFFRADHVALGIVDLRLRTRTVLGCSSSVLTRDEFSPRISESDAASYARMDSEGVAECIGDLAERPELNDASARVFQRGIRSLMRTPFRLSDGTLSTVTVGSTGAGQYGPTDAEALLDLCRPVGVAIDRVRLLSTITSTSAVLDSKTRVLAALVPGATVESVGAVFVEEALHLLGAVHAVAVLFDGASSRIAGMASHLLDGERAPMFFAEGPDGAGWPKGMADVQAQVIPDLALAERSPAEDYMLAAGVRSVMRAPIVDSGGKVRGMVAAGALAAFAWDEGHLATFTELAQSLGLVFERTQLYEAAEERAAKVQSLTRLLSTLNLQSPPEEVARLFARRVREYLGADGVMVHSFDSAAGQRVRVAFDARAGQPQTPDRIPLQDSTGFPGTLEQPHSRFSAVEPQHGPAWLRDAATAMGYGSAVCVRLDAAGESIGMIAAASVDPAGMGEDELEILAAVAPPLGMVLERARAVTSLRLQTQRTQAVLDILAALGPAESTDLIAGPVANALRVMYGADHCAIGTIEAGAVTLAAMDSNVMSTAPGQVTSFEALWGKLEAGPPDIQVVTDLADMDPAPENCGDDCEDRMRSSMRVLIGTESDPLGVVTVGSRQPGRFSEVDARQLAQIVQPLAVTARYFRSRRETAQRTERLETTNRILTRLSAGGTPEHLARGFLAECRQLFGSRHALAVQFDEEVNTGRLLAIDTDFPASEALPSEFALEEMHTARMLRQPTPQLVIDSRNEPAPNVRHLHLIDAGVYSAVRAPLVVHDRVRGAVSLWGEGAGRFTDEDAELLGTLTKPLALALEKASALESLGESELKYRSLVAQADEMIFVFDPVSLRILDANSFTSRALRYEPAELALLTLDRIIHASVEGIARSIATAVADGQYHLTDAKFLRNDGSTFDVDAVASMVAFGGRQAVLVLARDISERKALLQQLMQSQKMDSLGAMAGAVSHDFNNLLTTILGFAGLLKRSRNMDAEERENLALIEDAARRAADLTGRLLSFSRGGLVRFGRVDLRTVAEDTLQLAEPTLHAKLVVTRSLPDVPVLVEGDAGQLQQALTNIVLNARDAMPEGGSIELSLEVEGPLAVLRITDSGPGMDAETRMRIFEPFYTTKPSGSGTGLGMAITYGIIQGHHGDIAVQSAPGEGTQFTISLPLLENAGELPPADAFNAGEGNLVLVVDDDAMVRRATTATLTELGYNVVEAPGGTTAVEILRARPDRFSAVLLDLVMPGMTGSETFRVLTAIRPDLPVVVCTGYAAESHIDTDVKRRIAGLVQKPFTADRLARALTAAGAMPTRESRI